jgi:hypothetical protein
LGGRKEESKRSGRIKGIDLKGEKGGSRKGGGINN